MYTMHMLAPWMPDGLLTWFRPHEKLYLAVKEFYGGRDAEQIYRWTDLLTEDPAMKEFIVSKGLDALCRELEREDLEYCPSDADTDEED
jgi:hypothetical protein